MTEAAFPPRRSAADYAEAFADLFPTGPAWSRDPDAPLAQLLAGLSQVWERVDGRAADLLQIESDPRLTFELLDAWEAAYGLPDTCGAKDNTVEERRLLLVAKIAELGGQSIPFFTGLAARLGYAIQIREYSPFQCGISRVGDTRPTGANTEPYRWSIIDPHARFFWKIKFLAPRIAYFHCGVSRCGVDPLLRIAFATDLECLFRRIKPSHTVLSFDYSTVNPVYYEYVPFRCGVSHCGTDPLLAIVRHGGDFQN